MVATRMQVLFLLAIVLLLQGCTSSSSTGDDADQLIVTDTDVVNDGGSDGMDTTMDIDQPIVQEQDAVTEDGDGVVDGQTNDQDQILSDDIESLDEDSADDDLLAEGDETTEDAESGEEDDSMNGDEDQTGTLTEGEQQFSGAPADIGREADFTVLDPLGNGEKIVVDAATHLIWQQNVEYNDTYSGTSAWIHCYSLEHAGYKDWELPTVHELATIYSYGTTTFEYDEFFPNQSYAFWTNTIDHNNRRWVIYGTGKAEDAIYNTDLNYARCVRRAEVPVFTEERFTYEKGSDNKTIIVDHLTDLQWTPYIYYDSIMWGGALTTCENTTHGGYDDWRLPGVNEMRSIIDYGKYDPASNADYGYGSAIWTSAAYEVGERWIVDIKDGSQSPWESDGAFNVLCVRKP